MQFNKYFRINQTVRPKPEYNAREIHCSVRRNLHWIIITGPDGLAIGTILSIEPLIGLGKLWTRGLMVTEIGSDMMFFLLDTLVKALCSKRIERDLMDCELKAFVGDILLLCCESILLWKTSIYWDAVIWLVSEASKVIHQQEPSTEGLLDYVKLRVTLPRSRMSPVS